MFHRQHEFPAFHVTNSDECPYLPDRRERRIFTIAHGRGAAALYDTLAKNGFRRSQYALYKPACLNCSACLSARIRASDFAPTGSQRRILSRNRRLTRRLAAPVADREQFELFRKYVRNRHDDGCMAEMTAVEYLDMVEDSAVRTWLVLYFDTSETHRAQQELVAACITDHLDDGVSMVYSYFDPKMSAASLGTYMVLDHVRIVQASRQDLRYVYLGYWIPKSAKMGYKSRFSALEVLRDGAWIDVGDPDAYTPDFFPPV